LQSISDVTKKLDSSPKNKTATNKSPMGRMAEGNSPKNDKTSRVEESKATEGFPGEMRKVSLLSPTDGLKNSFLTVPLKGE